MMGCDDQEGIKPVGMTSESPPDDSDPSADTSPLLQSMATSTSPYMHKVTQHRYKFLHERQIHNNLLESNALKHSHHSSRVFVFLWDVYSSFALFGMKLISLSTIVGGALTIGATLIAYYLSPRGTDSMWDGNIPSLLLSFATVTPLIASVQMAFSRRETALEALAKYRSSMYHIYMAQVSWDWSECHKKKGRRGCVENMEDLKSVSEETGEDIGTTVGGDAHSQPIDWLDHGDTLLCQLIHLTDNLCSYLALPTSSRTHHRATKIGEKEAKVLALTGRQIFALNTTGRMFMISQLTEACKYRGMPGNEASRIRQWEGFMSNAMENMRMIKEYRTPQSLRLFGRLFSIFLPPLYATEFAQIAINTGSIWLGCIIAAVTSLCLNALFECVRQVEDPFAPGFTFDGIDVNEELKVLAYDELMIARCIIFPDAEEFVLKEDSYFCGGTKRRKPTQEELKEYASVVASKRKTRHYCENWAAHIDDLSERPPGPGLFDRNRAT